MNKFDFLRESFSHRAYKRKEYLLSVVAIGFEDPESKAIISPHPYAVWIEEGKFRFHDINGVVQTLEGDVNEPVFSMQTHFDLEADFHPCLQGKALRTTFGILLFNIVLFWETVGKVVPYQNKELTPGLVRGIISNIACDDPPEGQEAPEGKAPISRVLEISRNANYLEGILYAIVKCGSKDSLTVSKEVIALKNKLIKENKDRLSDPLVFNDIVEQCVNLDLEIQMKGESATFYIDKSYVSNCRKRMFIMFGIEFNSELNQWIPLTDPLTSGWDPNHLADYINTAVEGAYNRGKATGEGGARVKDILRIIASAHIEGEDCNSSKGEPIMIRKYNKGMWVGGNIIEKGKVVALTPENYDNYLDKVVMMRVPQFCTTSDGNYCQTCLGRGLGAYTNRIASDVTRVPTTFMLTRMKASHISGTSNSTVNWDAAFK